MHLHPLYASALHRGLVNNNFSYGYEACPGCAQLTVGGESRDPGPAGGLAAEAAKDGREGIGPRVVGPPEKAAYGGRVRALNSFENICVGLAQSHFTGEEFFRFPEVFEGISKSDVEDCVRRWMSPERTALSVVKPKGEKV